ncbi:hypothetical protein AJ79_03292 [Helicocarpus griseus UAMH5409]|uniref:Uncharacterized protein n=1 Tax=Helicocarpus griseus UAMH5409 TaxID=1447875 RepID=A0A2B7XZ20_9EURO|nr:hypothetical protein AJ79_03292 [Helicocarpus griseus UAMH5409]
MEENCNLLFIKLYVWHANRIITGHVADGKLKRISRAKIEMQILQGLERDNFPMNLRIAWISMVTHSNTFDIYWLGQQDLHQLSKSSIRRLEPDTSLANELISPSPSTSASSSRASSPSSPIANTGIVTLSSSDSDASSDVNVPITVETPNPEGEEEADTAANTTAQPAPAQKRLPRGQAEKKPAGVTKRRAPAKKKQSPAVLEEIAKSTDAAEFADGAFVNGQDNDDDKTAASDDSLFGDPDGRDDRGLLSPTETPDIPEGTATVAGALKKGQTASTRGRGGKKKTVRFDLP